MEGAVTDTVEELRGMARELLWYHGAFPNTTHCETCGLRLPCDSMLDAHIFNDAADEIERLQAAIAASHDGIEFITPHEYANAQQREPDQLGCSFCGEAWPCWAAVALGIDEGGQP